MTEAEYLEAQKQLVRTALADNVFFDQLMKAAQEAYAEVGAAIVGQFVDVEELESGR